MSFRVVWPPSGDTCGPSVVFEAVDVPCPGPLFVTLLIMSFCPLPDPDVGLSVLVCDVEHTSFHFGLCSLKYGFIPSGRRYRMSGDDFNCM